MLSPCFIGVNDFQRCFAFYAEVMAVLGHQLRFSESDRPWAGWQQPGVGRPLFVIAAAENGQPVAPGDGQMAAFRRKAARRPTRPMPPVWRQAAPTPVPRALSGQNASGRASRAI